jgi:non-specific serine/threonine protein kinase
MLARRRGDRERSFGLLAEALDWLRRYGAVEEAIPCVVELARLALDEPDMARAATLFGVASGLRNASGTHQDGVEQTRLARDLARIRAQLGPAQFSVAWSRGRSMTLEDAAMFAILRTVRVRATAARATESALTPREREVAGLVARGLTNRQVAEQLVISPGTVRIHVERILGKLGLTSRVQVATWVVGAEGDSSTDRLELAV